MQIHSTSLIKPSLPCHGLFPNSPSPFNPKPIHAPFTPFSPHHSVFVSKSTVEALVPKHSANSFHFASNCVENDGSLSNMGIKDVDVATLGNLCVDIVLNVPKLPPTSFEDRRDYMRRLSGSSPDKKYWEAGGNCNMAIATRRLGLQCITIGHVGNEVYGEFLLDVLHDEGIGTVEMSEEIDVNGSGASYETLLCWVLVDPLQRHSFCSRADFSKKPAFSWISELSSEVKMAIKRSKIMFCNGYDFDELSPALMISALDYAAEVGTSIFFDPGPRGKSLFVGTPEEQRALDHFLRMSDVLLLTSDEAESLTGIEHPVQAGKELLKNGVRTKWLIIKIGSKGSMLITKSSISCAPAFTVNVMDTVGCGDSFVAAIAFGFIKNMSMVSTLAVANAVGAATATGCGAGRNVATLKKVLQILREPNLNEDDQFWNEILKDLDAQEITFISKTVTSGNKLSNHVDLQKALSELLLKLESLNDSSTKGTVPSLEFS